jgi:YidC/Oxa1 family membrane protein insertase
MDRNLILAIVLTVAIIIGFQFVAQKNAPQKTVQPPKAPGQAAETIKPEAAKPPEPTKVPSAVKEGAPVTLAPAETPPKEEHRITVDSPKFEAVLSSLGGKIVSFKLKDYKNTVDKPDLVNLFESPNLDTGAPSLMFTTRDETFTDSGLNYKTNAPAKIELSQAGTTVVFESATDTGVLIKKTFSFDPAKYEVKFSFGLTNGSSENKNYLVTLPLRKVFDEHSANRFAWDSAEILLNGQLKDYLFKDIKGDEEPSGKITWAGLGDTYFFKAFVFENKPADKVTLLKPVSGSLAEIKIRYGAVDLAPGQTSDNSFAIYLGPKDRRALSAAGADLSKAQIFSAYWPLDYMAEYLMWFLRLTNQGFHVGGVKIPGTGNYGIDIIILTILLKILFIPLSHKSMKSMKRMQDLQPQLAKMKEKHKDDKAAQNKATMELFREHKVNPLGSCWPMFLQLPVFIALYQALSYAIELRHAPFMCMPSIYFCINDLSAPDPHYVTPILMGVSMAAQQWLTPSTGDPTQKKMMMAMPIFFTYLFLSFPAGLTLYWFVQNVLSIGQQVLTNKMAK